MRLAALLALVVALTGSAPALAQGPACLATPGVGGLLIRATVLTPEAALPDTEVLIDPKGLITCVGADCRSRAPGVAMIDCPEAVLSPGFVNTHEHLAFSHVPPVPDDGERYAHRHDWRKGLRGHQAREGFAASVDPADLAWGELRHLLSGTTSLVGGAMAPGLARNLDIHAGLEGLQTPRATYAVFPLDDAAGAFREGDCDYGPLAARTEAVAALHAWVAHIAEGVDGAARNEFACVSDPAFDTVAAPAGGGTAQDLILPRTAIVHGVALGPDDLRLVARRGAAIIWSPRSNLSLYGETLDVATALDLGVIVALSTDWLPSGSTTMPREAVCALDHARAAGFRLSGKTLWTMMTLNGARAVHMDGLIGSIRPGLAADLILVAPGPGLDPYDAVATLRSGDLLMVLRGGRMLAGRAPLAAGTGLAGPDCEAADLPGGSATLCLAGEVGATYAALASAQAGRGRWPAVFSGVPPVEPPCAVPEALKQKRPPPGGGGRF